MDKTLLIVDDDRELLQAIRMTLEAADFRVIAVDDAFRALEILADQDVHLILADIAMPNMNGYQLFTAVNDHPAWRFIPFIFLSARSLDSDVQYGKELGVDDYLIKPIRGAELLASVRGKLKRAERWSAAQGTAVAEATAPAVQDEVCVGNLRINLEQHRVWLDDEAIYLSPTEFRLLVCLTQKPGQVYSYQTLVQVTHQLETDAQDAGRLLRPLIGSLRRKLGYSAGDTGCVQNVRGIGYQFVMPTP